MKGFTLIEVLVTLTIISILAAIGIPTYFNQVEKAREVEVKILLSSLAIPIMEYRILNNEYPPDVNAGVNPGLSEWPTDVPFDSILDYDHWGIGSNTCVVSVTHFGKNKKRDVPLYTQVGSLGSIEKVGDDLVKTIAVYECENGRGSIR